MRRRERGEEQARGEPQARRRAERRPALRLARGTVGAPPAVCSPRSRGLHTRRATIGRCTSRRHRRASGQAALAEPCPLAYARARPGSPSVGPRVVGPSSACDGRAGRGPRPPGRDRATVPRPRRRPGREVASAPRWRSRPGAAPAAPRIAPRRVSSSGRSTWHETTAYRSGVVAGIAQLDTTSTRLSSWSRSPRFRGSLALALEREHDPRGVRREERPSSRVRSSTAGRSGSFPGVPSAYTQPLYGWFLAGLYWPLDRLVARRSGSRRSLVAVATALLVLAIGAAPRIDADRR